MVVSVGETVREPSTETEPMPLFIDALTAFVESQLKTELWPLVIDEGDIHMSHEGAAGAGTVTVIVLEQLTVTPLEFRNVPV